LSVFIDFKGADEVNQPGPWWKKLLKCGDSPQKQDEIQKLLKDVGLWEYRNTVAKNLSGGSKRKLSVAIALCGNSKFVLLDEPTAGMDL
jgi:ABC-type multidrug transport system ATPase subunit